VAVVVGSTVQLRGCVNFPGLGRQMALQIPSGGEMVRQQYTSIRPQDGAPDLDLVMADSDTASGGESRHSHFYAGFYCHVWANCAARKLLPGLFKLLP
jgi:hypothetical protein